MSLETERVAKVARIERDALGDVRVPVDALWGAQTQRAVANFPISGQCFGRGFIAAMGYVKRACAQNNQPMEIIYRSWFRTPLKTVFPPVSWMTLI